MFFSRVLVANRGRDRRARDPRAARARDRGRRRLLDRRPRRAARAARRPRGLHRAAARGRELPAHPVDRRGGRDDGLRGRASRATGSWPRTRRSSRPAPRTTSSSSARAPDVMERMGDKIAREGASCGPPACRSCPARTGRRRSRRPRRAAAEIGYPVLLKAAAGGGGKGMRLVERSGRARGRLPRRRGGGGGGVRRRRRSTSRRRSQPARHVEIQVLARRARRRADARRARVLDPAPPPEADRGVAVAGADAGAREAMEAAGRARRAARDRLPQRRHVRVPARRRTARSTSSS